MATRKAPDRRTAAEKDADLPEAEQRLRHMLCAYDAFDSSKTLTDVDYALGRCRGFIARGVPVAKGGHQDVEVKGRTISTSVLSIALGRFWRRDRVAELTNLFSRYVAAGYTDVDSPVEDRKASGSPKPLIAGIALAARTQHVQAIRMLLALQVDETKVPGGDLLEYMRTVGCAPDVQATVTELLMARRIALASSPIPSASVPLAPNAVEMPIVTIPTHERRQRRSGL
jgi:hypothetical protein